MHLSIYFHLHIYIHDKYLEIYLTSHFVFFDKQKWSQREVWMQFLWFTLWLITVLVLGPKPEQKNPSKASYVKEGRGEM